MPAKLRLVQSYRETLKSTFEHRRKKNPAYSLRSFAGDLGVGASTLSEVLSHKKKLARKTGVKTLSTLALNKREKDLFLLSIDHESPSISQSRKDIEVQMASHLSQEHVLTTRDDQQDLIANPLYPTLLAFFHVENFRFNLTWISNLLGVFQHETTRPIKGLQAAGSIRLDQENEPEILRNFILTPDGAKIEAVRAYHHDTLKRATVALDTVPRSERDFCSTIMPIDPSDFKAIQEEIRSFIARFFKNTVIAKLHGVFIPYKTN